MGSVQEGDGLHCSETLFSLLESCLGPDMLKPSESVVKSVNQTIEGQKVTGSGCPAPLGCCSQRFLK